MFPGDDLIDQLIRDADPARTPRNAGVDPKAMAVRDRIVSAPPRHRRRKKSRSRTSLVASLLAVMMVSGGSVALAGDGNETPWGWIADNVFSIQDESGKFCFNGIQVQYEGVDHDSPIVLDSREIIGGIDVDALDTTAAEVGIRAEMAEATNLDGEPEPVVLSDAQVHQQAVVDVVAKTLWHELKQRGYDLSPSPVSLSGRSDGCGS